MPLIILMSVIILLFISQYIFIFFIFACPRPACKALKIHNTGGQGLHLAAAFVPLTVPVHTRQISPEVAGSMGGRNINSIDHDWVTLKYKHTHTQIMNAH